MVVVPSQEKGKMGWLIETTSLFCAARLANPKYQQGVLLLKHSINVVARW